MKNGYNLVRFTNVQSKDNIVESVDYEVIEHLGTEYKENDVFTICYHRGLEFCDIMIVKVEDGKVIECCDMVFSYEEEETGDIVFWLDCCEYDFRVYATVAFGVDLI